MTGQVVGQRFKCPVIRQKRPVMTDDRTLFPALGGEPVPSPTKFFLGKTLIVGLEFEKNTFS